MNVCTARLKEERKQFRKDHPPGWVAKPKAKPDGTRDLMEWECTIQGPKGTVWADSWLPVTLTFNEDYPRLPPQVSLPKGFFHINIFDSGVVCLSITNAYGWRDDKSKAWNVRHNGWKPSISVLQILTGVRDLLAEPTPDGGPNSKAWPMYRASKTRYNARIKKEAQKYAK